jgi:hypothetical protein
MQMKQEKETKEKKSKPINEMSVGREERMVHWTTITHNGRNGHYCVDKYRSLLRIDHPTDHPRVQLVGSSVSWRC